MLRRGRFALASLALFCVACAEPPAAVSPASPQASAAAPAVVRYSVHVDTLDRAKVAQFEEARVRFVKDLATRNISDHRGLYLRVGESTYWSVMRFDTWTELDALSNRRRQAQQAMKGIVEEYDRLSDESLVFPHKNEIWTERLDLSYLPTGRELHQAVRVDIEDVRPMADYEAAWKPIAEALAEARYPLERRTFFSGYGTGRMLSFWLEAAGESTDIMPLDRALTLALGDAKAAELLAGLRACVIATETHEVKVPLAMASPAPGRR
jgi:hypothetical protein